jgi:hypothetical protein
MDVTFRENVQKLSTPLRGLSLQVFETVTGDFSKAILE